MRFFVLALLSLSLVACGGSDSDDGSGTNTPIDMGSQQTPEEAGEMVFTSSSHSNNNFSCSTCHAIKENDSMVSTVSGFVHPAEPLFNVVNKTSYMNGTMTELRDAVNMCRVDWMDTNVWSESDVNWQNLLAYLNQESDDAAISNSQHDIVTPITDFSSASYTEGQDSFNESCALCHGDNGAGSSLGVSLVGKNLSKLEVAEKVRTSGPTNSAFYANLSGGNMPFYSAQRMSDETLADIARFVAGERDDDQASYQCGNNDHPKVGQQAILSTVAHNVSGTVTIVDNCTIEVTQFNYDGTGPDVYFYGGVDRNYEQNGVRLSQKLDSTVYNNGSYTINLTDPSALDVINSISVWCHRFTENFGDGLFE